MPHRGPKKRNLPHQPRTRKTSALKYVGHGTDQERAALLERLPDAFVSVDPHWQFTYINRQVEALVGKGREELLGRNVWDIFPIPADSLLYRNAHKAMDMQTTLEFTQFHPLLNKWFALRLYPFHDGLYNFCQDITERKHAEELLQVPAKTFWDVNKSMIVTDLQGKIIYWNEGASRLFGYTAEEMLGQTPALLYPELEKDQLAIDLEQIRKGKDYTGHWQGRRKDGTRLPLLASVSIIKDSSEKIIGAIAANREIREREESTAVESDNHPL